MKKALLRKYKVEKTCFSLRGDISPEILGNVSGVWGYISGLRGNVSGIQGDVSVLRGDVSWLRGDVSGLQGDVTGLWGICTGIEGDVDECKLTAEERREGVEIGTLIAIEK